MLAKSLLPINYLYTSILYAAYLKTNWHSELMQLKQFFRQLHAANTFVMALNRSG